MKSNSTTPNGAAPMQAANLNCACGEAFPVHPAGYCGGSGYAITASGEKICYSCADKAQREELKDRSKPFCAYVSGDGKLITSWTGGELMKVTQSWPCQLTRSSNWHDSKSYRSIRATDCHGRKWYGRGSAGVCITLRAAK